VSEVTYYRWRQEYGGLKTEQVKRLKELETENNQVLSKPFSHIAWFKKDRSGQPFDDIQDH
jgi:hypothetical protein